MPGKLPKFDPGAAITYTASAAIVGGQLVVPTGDRRVGPAGAGALNCVGVALGDAAAEAEVVVQREGVFELTANGAIAAGANVRCAAAGEVETIGANDLDQKVGVALEAIADNATGEIALTLT